MRKLDWIVLILMVSVAIGGKIFGAFDPVSKNYSSRRPDPLFFNSKAWDSETRDWLQEGTKSQRPAVRSSQPQLSSGLILEEMREGSSSGSAFSVSSQGYWLTARHVVEGCDKVYLRTGPRDLLKVLRSTLHPRADVALLVTNGAPEGLPISNSALANRNSFNVGFPKGSPGAVHGQFIGEMTMRHKGRRRYEEQVYAWTILSEIPRKFISLGGLSGGAVIDDSGRIIGIVQAEAPRRGRFMTAKPEALLAMFDLADIDRPVTTVPASLDKISDENYESMARDLITSLRVAKVFCVVADSRGG